MTRLNPYARRVLLLLLVAAAAERAGATERLEAKLERARVPFGDRAHLTVTLHGLARAPMPRFPEVPGLEIHLLRQVTQLDRTGTAKPSLIFLYVVEAAAPGTYQLGPITLTLPGRELTAEALTLTVTEATTGPVPADVFTTATVSVSQPFVGQQVLYTWRFFRRVRVVKARLDPYRFDGFHAEELGEGPAYETTVAGLPYLVHERRIALFPQRAGELVVTGPTLRCGVINGRLGAARLMDGSFGGFTPEARRIETAPITLTVRELPAAPEGFSGLIGRFAITASLSKGELRVGDSVLLRLVVTGNGPPELLQEPQIAGLAGFKSYAEKPVSHTRRTEQGVTTERVFSRALVPLEAGGATIPAVPLVYFDPEGAAYRRTASEPLALSVLPAIETAAQRTAAAVVPRRPARETSPGSSEPGSEAEGLSLPQAAMVATAVLVPSLLLLGLVVMRRRSRPTPCAEALRRERALPAALSRLAEVDAALESRGGGDACCAASRILRSYLGDRLGYEGTAATAAETATRLAEAGLPEDLRREVETTLAGIEAGQFSGGCQGGPCATATLRSLLERLDAATGRG
ncbi:MAG TPA: BatD family protein [Thermoanaerobaculia bacterium]|nr:BatD family protein [Thermoanaerobaculia bacterium]